jgi:hypothetical protein
MSEEEPALPMDLPVKTPRRPWRQRVKAIFTEPIKLPGWVVIAITAIQVIPDWKSRFDFWLDVAKQTGGYLAVAATVISSPYFMPSFFTAGLAWVVFAGESPIGVQRHHWLRYLAWSVVSICLTILVLTVGYGAYTLQIKQEVSQEDAELQRKYAVRPVFWHLTILKK